MADTGGMNLASNSDPLSMDVDEIAAILRQVQSGQLTIQQHLRQEYGNKIDEDRIIEDDEGLALVQQRGDDRGTDQNLVGFSQQPLRRPGRALHSNSWGQVDTVLSKGALQKQIFQARMLGTPIANRIPEQSPASSSIKPNLSASRPSRAVISSHRAIEGVEHFNQGMTVSGSSSTAYMVSKNIPRQQLHTKTPTNNSSVLMAKHTVPGLYQSSPEQKESSPEDDDFARSTPWELKLSSFHGTNTALSNTEQEQQGQHVSSHVNQPQSVRNSNSQDKHLQWQEMDYRSSSYAHLPTTRMVGPFHAVPSSSAYQISVTGQSTVFTGVRPPVNAEEFVHATTGLTQTSNSSSNHWDVGKEDYQEDRKRRLHDDVAEVEMQVGPSKQRRTGLQPSVSRLPLGEGSVQQSGWGTSAGTELSIVSGTEEVKATPYRWNTDFTEENDQDDVIDLDQWIDSLVTYKKPDESEADMLQNPGESFANRRERGSRRKDRRRSNSPDKQGRRETSRKRSLSVERNRRGVFSKRVRGMSPVGTTRHRSPGMSRQGVISRQRRSLSSRHSERDDQRLGRDQFLESGKDERGLRSPRRDRVERSPRHSRADISPRHESVECQSKRITRRGVPRLERSPLRHDRAEESSRCETIEGSVFRQERAASPSNLGVAERSSRHERSERSPWRGRSERAVPLHDVLEISSEAGTADRLSQPVGPDHQNASRGAPRQQDSSQGKVADKSRSSRGKDEKMHRSSGDIKKTDSNKRRDLHKKDGSKTYGSKREQDKRSKSPVQGLKQAEEKKKIQINLQFKRGKDNLKSREYSDRLADDKNPVHPRTTNMVDQTLQLVGDYSQKTCLSLKEEIDKEKNLTLDEMAEIVGDNSIQHQISLFTKLDMIKYIENKELMDWFCHLCQMPCITWKSYLSHVVGKKHKINITKAYTVSAEKALFVKYLQTLPELERRVTKSGQSSNKQQSSTTKGNPVGKSCYNCFRTYTCSLQEHLDSNCHKKSKQQHHVRGQHGEITPVVTNDSKDKGVTKTGLELIIPVYGYFCRACTKFYNNEKMSREEHSVSPDHIQKVKNYYNKSKMSTERAQVLGLADDKSKQTETNEVKSASKKPSGERDKEQQKKSGDNKEIIKIQKREIVKGDIKEQNALLKTNSTNTTANKSNNNKNEKAFYVANRSSGKVPAMQIKSSDTVIKSDVKKPKADTTQQHVDKTTDNNSIKLKATPEIPHEVLAIYDGKCARNRLYTRKVNTDSVRKNATLMKATNLPVVQNASAPSTSEIPPDKELLIKQDGVKSEPSGTVPCKENTSKKVDTGRNASALCTIGNHPNKELLMKQDSLKSQSSGTVPCKENTRKKTDTGQNASVPCTSANRPNKEPLMKQDGVKRKPSGTVPGKENTSKKPDTGQNASAPCTSANQPKKEPLMKQDGVKRKHLGTVPDKEDTSKKVDTGRNASAPCTSANQPNKEPLMKQDGVKRKPLGTVPDKEDTSKKDNTGKSASAPCTSGNESNKGLPMKQNDIKSEPSSTLPGEENTSKNVDIGQNATQKTSGKKQIVQVKKESKPIVKESNRLNDVVSKKGKEVGENSKCNVVIPKTSTRDVKKLVKKTPSKVVSVQSTKDSQKAKQEDKKKDKLQENAPGKQSGSLSTDHMARSCQRSRSETAKQPKKSLSPGQESKSLPQNKDSLSNKEKHSSAVSRERRSTRTAPVRPRCQGNKQETSSSHDTGKITKNNKERAEGKKSPQKCSSSKQREDNKSRADTSRRSQTSNTSAARNRGSCTESQSSRRPHSRSKRMELDFPNMDNMVAIDEVGSSGDEQDVIMVAVDAVVGSDMDNLSEQADVSCSDEETDSQALEAMMHGMGADWQVVSYIK